MTACEVLDQLVLLRQIFENKERAGFDDYFYSLEKLPIGRKEYWFLYFTSTTGSLQQMVLTFGKSNPSATVNLINTPAAEEHTVFGWFYDLRKNVFASSNAELGADKAQCRLEGRWNDGGFEFRKKPPNHELTVKNVCRLVLSVPANGPAQESYALLSIPKTSIGANLYNAYFDVKGTLNEKKFNGKAYVQKVVLTAPFVPWDWGRITFRDGSILDFLVVKLGVENAAKEIFSQATFYHAGKNETMKFNGVAATKKSGFFRVNANGFSLSARIYAEMPFVMQSVGRFLYDEHLVKLISFSLPSKNIGLSDLGGGIGLIERARGYML